MTSSELDLLQVPMFPTEKAATEEESPITILQGDALEQLKSLPDNSVDSLVTDPPAGIAFMGKTWDDPSAESWGAYDSPDARKDTPRYLAGKKPLEVRDKFIEGLTPIFAEALRVMKPGAHGLVWALPRTSGWTQTALENAGFECRDIITHHYGTGFCKNRNFYLNDILPEAEKQLRELGVDGDIVWRRPEPV